MLQSVFFDELLKSCTTDLRIFKVVATEVHDRDISKENKSQKKALAVIKRLHKKDGEVLPSLGLIEQMVNATGIKSMSLDKIIEAKPAPPSALLEELGEYLKKVRVQSSIQDFTVEFNKGEYSDSISELRDNIDSAMSIKLGDDEIVSSNPFGDFFNIIEDLESDETSFVKVPFGIPRLDEISYGGMNPSDTALFLLRSGVGKSTILKYVGFYASRIGYRVMHFQLEGTKLETDLKYNQQWTGLNYKDMLKGHMPNMRNHKMEYTQKKVWSAEKGVYYISSRSEYLQLVLKKMEYAKRFGKFDLEVVSIEELGSPNMSMVDEKVQEYKDKRGYAPELIIIDSLDLVYPMDGLSYGYDIQSTKMRIQNSAKDMKNIATKYKSRIATATQASNVKMEDWNNPEFCIDRSYSLGDKNVANPFSFVATGNRTNKEKRDNEIRWFLDKLRDYDGEGEVIKTSTSYDSGKAISLNPERKYVNSKEDEDTTNGDSVNEGT